MNMDDIKSKIESLKEMLELVEKVVDKQEEKKCKNHDNECVIEIKKAFMFLFKKQHEVIEFNKPEDFYNEIKKIHPKVKEREFPEYDNLKDFAFHLGYEIGRLCEKLRPKD